MGDNAVAILLFPRRLLRRLCAVSLRADDRHLHPVVPGPGRRPDLPDERRLAALVRQAVLRGGHRRHRCCLQAVAHARPRRHGPDGRAFGLGRHGLPQIVPRRDRPVLCRHRQPDHAVDHHLARHRSGIPVARRFHHQKLAPRVGRRQWGCSPQALART